MILPPPTSTLFPYTTLFRSVDRDRIGATGISGGGAATFWISAADDRIKATAPVSGMSDLTWYIGEKSEEHTSELQSRRDLVCRLLLEKKKHTGPTAV